MGSVGVDVSLFESRALGNPFGVLKDSVVESSAGADVAPKVDFFFGPIVYNGQQFEIAGFPVSYFLIIIIIAWIAVGLRWWNEKKDWTSLLIMVAAVTIIGYYISGFMPGG